MKIHRLLRCFVPLVCIVLLAPLAVACKPEPVTVTINTTETAEATVNITEYPISTDIPIVTVTVTAPATKLPRPTPKITTIIPEPVLPDFSSDEYPRHPYQAIVDNFIGIDRIGFPLYFMETNPARQFTDEFDVNEYFTVLTHIHMKEGYVLDYVYNYTGSGGYPVLYARKATRAPYVYFKDLPEDVTNWREYLEIEDTTQGFFEYLILDALGAQFCLFWHSMYYDLNFICDVSGIEAVTQDWHINEILFPYEYTYTRDLDRYRERQQEMVDILVAATKLDLKPVVILGNDSVTISLVTFTKWGGFEKMTVKFNRDTPYTRIGDPEYETLIYYECGIMF